MEKHLIRVGNSLALVIDKTVCRLAGIGPRTPLDLSLHNGKIIITPQALPNEPIRVDGELVGETFKAIMYELIERHFMSQITFARLHHAPIALVPYVHRLAATNLREDAAEEASRRRLRACLVAIRSGMDWPAATEAALREVPRTPSGG